jgi:hypothetical protein
MPSEERRFSGQEFLAALEKGWKHYLSQLAELSEEEQNHFAQEQGFLRIQDLLVHIFAWWERSMQRTTWLLSNPPLPPTQGHPLFGKSMDEWNAEAIARYQHWTRDDVEAKFTTTLAALEAFLQDLPEAAFEQERIQFWMRVETVDHYEKHCLPQSGQFKRGTSI